jgi:Carbamoyl-phosphate synthase L chain, ATP binding domain
MISSPRMGWFFAYDWDRAAMRRLGAPGRPVACDHAGFDLFAFPSQLKLPTFDLERFAARQAARGKRRGWRAVLSHHEQFGALAAAMVAERLGLPGATPASILAAQHKLHARRVLQQVAPDANLAFTELDIDDAGRVATELAYPLFMKPVKGAFSVLARRIDGPVQLCARTRFNRSERWLIRQLTEPFDRVCRDLLPQAGSAYRMLLEQAVAPQTPQFNLDGWVQDGRVHALGVVDAVMYPGTEAFMRWEHPSRLAADVQRRALDVAQRFLRAIGYAHGFFNLEFFYDEHADRLSVIECNPRLASQFSDLYERVHGCDAHAMALALALGEDPRALPLRQPTARAAASLVYRSFDAQGVVPLQPAAAQRAGLTRRFPDAQLFSFAKRGRALARDFRWTGSHRYAIVHLGGQDREHLRQRCEDASGLLGWPAPYFDCLPLPSRAHATLPRGVTRDAPSTEASTV